MNIDLDSTSNFKQIQHCITGNSVGMKLLLGYRVVVSSDRLYHLDCIVWLSVCLCGCSCYP